MKILKEAGAAEVHMRISSPPVIFPCFYGIDTDSQVQLLAAGKDLEEIREFIGADSLKYLSYEGLLTAAGCPRSEFCLACFDGVYPIPLSEEQKEGKSLLESETGKK